MTIDQTLDPPAAGGRAWADDWQRTWDAQQEAFLVDREQRFAYLLDLVEIVAGPAPTVLDLACGTGSITRRLLDRLPAARAVAIDVDPVLLTVARGSLGHDERVRIVRADLREAGWAAALDGSAVDAVVTSTALHWLPEHDLRRVYRDLHRLLRPGDLLANADTMAVGGLPSVSSGVTAQAERRTAARITAGTEAWDAWWRRAASDPVLAGPMAERATLFGGDAHPSSFSPPDTWHVDALRDAGFAEVGMAWRSGTDAIVAAIR
jgi:SAM-dependent methyltransferase